MANFPVAFQGSPITRGVTRGLAIRQRREQAEAAKKLKQAEQLFVSHNNRLARFDEKSKKILETVQKLAASGAEDEQLRPWRALFATTVANRAKLQQQFKVMALEGDTSPEVIDAALPDAAQGVQSRLPFFDAAVQIGRSEREEGEVRTLPPDELQQRFPGLPEGAIIQEKPDGELMLKFDPSSNNDPSSFREQVTALMEADPNLDFATAVAIKAGRRAISIDPITRERAVIDLATGERVGGPDERPAPEGEVPAMVPEDIEAAAATGAPGMFKNLANIVVGAFNADPVSPEAQKATEAMNTVQKMTGVHLQAAVPGRPSKFLLEELKELTVTPNSLLQGESRARERLKQTKRLLDGEIARIEHDVLPLDLQPNVRVETQLNLTQLERLSESYGILLESFPEEEADELSQEVRNLLDKYAPEGQARD